MKKLLTLFILLSTTPAYALMADQIRTYGKFTIAPDAEVTKIVDQQQRSDIGTQVIKRDRDGYYVDGRNQIPEYQRIAPPHPENIPTEPKARKTVVPYDSYYDVNVLGIRRHPYMTPVIPNYNRYYSERRAYPYTKEDFVNVWCEGDKFKDGVDCQSEQYAITFAKASDWAGAVIKAPFKAKKAHKKTALFIMVDDLALDAKYMHDVKMWGELFNVQVWFGTIDSYIPSDYII